MAKTRNVMEMVPVRNEHISWEKKADIITLKINRQGFLDKIMHRLFKSPKTITVELEEIGSFIWEQCDGVKNVHEISLELEEHFGQKVEPLVARLLQYLKILTNNNFIKLK